MALCTSTAAPSISRSRENCRLMLVLPGGAARGHRIQARDAGELPLEHRRHGRGHGVRVRAGKAGADVDGGIVDGRQVAHRHRPVADDAEQSDPRHQQAGGDGTPDEDFREVQLRLLTRLTLSFAALGPSPRPGSPLRVRLRRPAPSLPLRSASPARRAPGAIDLRSPRFRLLPCPSRSPDPDRPRGPMVTGRASTVGSSLTT